MVSKRFTHGSGPRDRRESRDRHLRLERAEKQARRRNKMPLPFDTTWTCHICGEERPDELIEVIKIDISYERGLPPGTMVQNVRYCIDKAECAIAAREYRHAPVKTKDMPDDPRPDYTDL